MCSDSLIVFIIRILFFICFSFSLLHGEEYPDTSASIKSPKKVFKVKPIVTGISTEDSHIKLLKVVCRTTKTVAKRILIIRYKDFFNIILSTQLRQE